MLTAICERLAVRTTKRLNNIPTASGGITRAAYAFAARTRVPVGALLKRANLSLQQAKNAQMRIAVKDQIEFLNLVADELDDEFLGIRLAQTVDLRELGLLYYVMASSDTVSGALRRASRYSAIINEGVQIGYRAGKFVFVTFDYRGVARQRDRHQIEFFITILLRMCRKLSGLLLAPLRVVERARRSSRVTTNTSPSSSAAKIPDHGHPWLLRPRRERP